MTTFETWTVPAKRIDYQAAAQERNRRRRKLRDAAPDLLAALEELDAWAIYAAAQNIHRGHLKPSAKQSPKQ
jgi:hypothetical protein